MAFFKKQNILANVFFYIGIIWFLISIIPIWTEIKFILEQNYPGEDEWRQVLNFVVYFMRELGTGLLLIALAEVIELLDRLSKKKDTFYYIPQPEVSTASMSVAASIQQEEVPKYDTSVPEITQNKIKDFYVMKGIIPVKFYKTPFDNLIYIEFDNYEPKAVIFDHYNGVKVELPKYAWSDELTKWLSEQGIYNQN